MVIIYLHNIDRKQAVVFINAFEEKLPEACFKLSGSL